MVRDTPPSQDASTHQIWNSYLKEYRRYGPDTKAGRTDGHTDGHTDGRTVRLLYASQSSFGGITTVGYIFSEYVHCDMRFLVENISALLCFLDGLGIAVPVLSY